MTNRITWEAERQARLAGHRSFSEFALQAAKRARFEKLERDFQAEQSALPNQLSLAKRIIGSKETPDGTLLTDRL